jgi:hypothetical protein
MLDAECERHMKSECSGTLSGPDPVKKQYLWEKINDQVRRLIK